ncbi:MAG: hypothetical protein Q7T41_03410 [Candidatus Saccharibacteria bacterium]|nr:hypothetical protein [Candidatus Saccharibacteria bacterium]
MSRKLIINFQKKFLGVAVIAILMLVLATFNYLGSKIHTRSIPSGSITLTTDYAKYLVGDTVSFTITNNFNSTIYVNNNCPDEPLEIYKYQTNGTWVQVHDEKITSECKDSDRQIIISANDSVTGNFSRWPNLFKEPGRYRVVAYVDYYNELPYQDFEVVEKPAVPEIPEPTTESVVLPSPTTSNGTSTGSGTNTSTSQNQSQTGSTEESSPETQTVSISAGDVVVSIDGTYITVISVTPQNGYTSYEGGRSGTNVEITFKGNGETQLQLSVRNGQLVTKIEDD